MSDKTLYDPDPDNPDKYKTPVNDPREYFDEWGNHDPEHGMYDIDGFLHDADAICRDLPATRDRTLPGFDPESDRSK